MRCRNLVTWLPPWPGYYRRILCHVRKAYPCRMTNWVKWIFSKSKLTNSFPPFSFLIIILQSSTFLPSPFLPIGMQLQLRPLYLLSFFFSPTHCRPWRPRPCTLADPPLEVHTLDSVTFKKVSDGQDRQPGQTKPSLDLRTPPTAGSKPFL